jgi:shikimate kinase
MHLPGSVRNLVLIGFMGSGKSSVGREIARRCQFRFLDTDSVIRQRYGKSIGEIFAIHGEPAFRDAEHQVLHRLRDARHFVIATGGGIVLQARNHSILRSIGPVVWLTADEDVIWQRVSRNRNRPLLQTADPRSTIHDLLQVRYPLYREAADIIVETSILTHQEVATRILLALRSWATKRHEDQH